MSRTTCFAVPACLLLTAAAAAFPGGGLFPIDDRVPSPFATNLILDRFSKADCVVTARVRAIEDKSVITAAYTTDVYPTVYKVAALTVTESFVGAKKGETLRALFRQVYSPKFKDREWAVGEEGCFFLQKHHEGAFHIVRIPFPVSIVKVAGVPGSGLVVKPGADFLKPDAPTFEKGMLLVRRCVKVLEDPLATLKTGTPDDRLLTAALLIARYRALNRQPALFGTMAKTAPPKTAPIDAEESRLILRTLTEVPLTQRHVELGIYPLDLFVALRLRAEDGWTVAGAARTNVIQYANAATAWLARNGPSYRIQRVLPE